MIRDYSLLPHSKNSAMRELLRKHDEEKRSTCTVTDVDSAEGRGFAQTLNVWSVMRQFVSTVSMFWKGRLKKMLRTKKGPRS